VGVLKTKVVKMKYFSQKRLDEMDDYEDIRSQRMSMSENVEENISADTEPVIHPKELWLHENPEAMGAVLRGLAGYAAGELVAGPDMNDKDWLDEVDEEELSCNALK
jgi:post-segregation antitoxin (ccd killing protein)